MYAERRRPPRRIAFAAETRGTTAVEFALVLPVFLLMLFGVFQFGYAFYCGSSVRAMVQKDARLLIATPTTTAAQLQTAVNNDLKSLVKATVTVTTSVETLSNGNKVTRISWRYLHPVLFPFYSGVTLNFSSSTIVPQIVP